MAQVKEVSFERTYDAPGKLVWQAWTNPEMIKQWWGPNNVIIPECEIDLRVGGKIYIVMEAGEAMGPYKGTKWPMLGEFTLVEPNSHLVYTAHAWTEGQDEETRIDQVAEISLAEQGGETVLKLKATVNKFGPAAQMAIQGMRHGFSQQLEKLSKFLAHTR
jgi:uncharacterized protein YndB with AHSA1/START domain